MKAAVYIFFGVALIVSSAAMAAEGEVTDCPGRAGQSQASKQQDQKTAQPAEKSAILPSAGEHEKSEAPTMKLDGRTAENSPTAKVDCGSIDKEKKG